MVYRLKPLYLKLSFEDRTYKLRGTLYVSVDPLHNGEVVVYEGHPDLSHEDAIRGGNVG